MQRYDTYCDETDVKESKNGYWVKYEDAQKEIDALKTEIERLKEILKDMTDF